jgi:hypothetical protein
MLHLRIYIFLCTCHFAYGNSVAYITYQVKESIFQNPSVCFYVYLPHHVWNGVSLKRQ